LATQEVVEEVLIILLLPTKVVRQVMVVEPVALTLVLQSLTDIEGIPVMRILEVVEVCLMLDL
tara:strand:- start:11 stop:199 length:189 start_codon:yes stop_codon:yes gene_type:complete